MPLQKIQLRPGVNREGTTLANEGGWFECDNVRFRSGFPQKIGGWAVISYNTFLGVARSMWNWVTLKGYNLLGVGTNLKFYIESGGEYYDITPIRETTPAGAATFDTINTSPIVTVNDIGHGAQTGDFVTFTLSAPVGGLDLNHEYQITYLTANTYTVTASTPATSTVTGGGGAATLAAYQITTGFDIYTIGTGWGAGPWSRLGWGDGYTTGIGLQLRLWSQTNFGETLLFSPRDSALYY